MDQEEYDDKSQLYLRVHSNDLFEHIASEVGECLDTGLYTDLILRTRDGHVLHAHKLVLAAISPYFRNILSFETEEIMTIEFPDFDREPLQRLLEVIYNGSIEASIEEMKFLIDVAHSFYISIPLSEDLTNMLDLKLPFMTPLEETTSSINFNQSSPIYDMESIPIIDSSPENNSKKKTAHEFLCPICNSTYCNLGNFKQHMKRHENDEQESVKDFKLAQINQLITTWFDPISSQYTCQVCNSTYSHPGNFKQHLFKHEREANGIFSRRKSRLANPMAAHGGSNHLSKVLHSAFADKVDPGDRDPRSAKKMYECEYCKRVFKHPGNYKQHIASHLRMNNIQIPANAVNFPTIPISQSSLPKPETEPSMVSESSQLDPNRCSTKTRWKCSHCPEEVCFLSRGKLRAHVQSYHKSALISSDSQGHNECNLCHQVYSTEEQLSEHKETHHQTMNNGPSVSDFECKICKKVFNKGGKLNAHMRIHSAPEDHYRYPCEVCGKKFTRSQHVQRHKLLHTGEKPYKCNLCNKLFAREDKYKIHATRECEFLKFEPDN